MARNKKLARLNNIYSSPLSIKKLISQFAVVPKKRSSKDLAIDGYSYKSQEVFSNLHNYHTIDVQDHRTLSTNFASLPPLTHSTASLNEMNPSNSSTLF
jgi:hypothetical protein